MSVPYPSPSGALRAAYKRLKLLHRVSKAIHSTLDSAEALRLITREAVRLVRGTSGAVALLNPTTGLIEIETEYGCAVKADRPGLSPTAGIIGWVVRTGRPARIGDVGSNPHGPALRPGARSVLAVPFVVGQDVRGVLSVDSGRLHAFTENDEMMLVDLSEEAARAINMTWRYEQLRRKAHLFESLAGVSQSINSALSLDDALNNITHEACTLMGGRMCSLMLVDPQRTWLDLRAAYGASESYRNKPRLSVADSLLGVVVRRQKPVQVENVQTSARYQNVEMARREGLVSLLSVPLVHGDVVIGTLSLYTAQPHKFSDEEIRVLTALANLSAVAIERARLYERLIDVEEQLRRSEQLSALGLIAAEVAHEIRNPLAVMKMLFHSLDLKFARDDPRTRDAEILATKMDQLDKTVDRILDLARHTAPASAPVDVNRLLEDIVLLTRHKLRKQNVTCTLHLAPDLPRVNADTAQIGQAFLNLTLNAAQAMAEGGRLTITTRKLSGSSSGQIKPRISVVFADTGHGMTEEQKQLAFKSRISSDKPGGSGLGLLIVARIVEGHGGTIRAASAPACGTKITIVLPAEPG